MIYDLLFRGSAMVAREPVRSGLYLNSTRRALYQNRLFRRFWCSVPDRKLLQTFDVFYQTYSTNPKKEILKTDKSGGGGEVASCFSSVKILSFVIYGLDCKIVVKV